MESNEITAREGGGSRVRERPVRVEAAQPVDNANKRLAKLD